MVEKLLFNVMHRINSDVFTFLRQNEKSRECQVAHFWIMVFDLWTINGQSLQNITNYLFLGIISIFPENFIKICP